MSINVPQKKRGRPATGANPRVGVRMEPETIQAIEQACADQEDKPNQSEMIRRILGDWLIGNGYLKAEE